MKISVREARQRLATAGIRLGKSLRKEPGASAGFQVITPLGTEIRMQSQDIVHLLGELNLLPATGDRQRRSGDQQG